MFQMMEFVRWLILIKIVTQNEKRLKKDCDKKIVIIEKDYDN